jgi:N-hydroxyarylamine O-acetyltransferase
MIDAYLARIGYEGPRDASPATLRALHERHLLSVPFENLDIHWKRPIIVDTQSFLQKIVIRRRGGFCYELNGAFAWLLREFGFDVTLLSGRVPTANGGLGPPFDHMALLIHAGGARWLADVGFGDSFLHPLHLDGDNGEFEIVRGEECEVRRNGTREYLFTLDPHELHEFAPMCDFQQYDPRSSFTKKRVCTIATPDGRVTLADAKLVVARNGEKTETPIAAEEWDRVLYETFGIAAPEAGARSEPGSRRKS